MKIRNTIHRPSHRVYMPDRAINFAYLEKTNEVDGIYQYPHAKVIAYEGHIGSAYDWAKAVNKNPSSIRNRLRINSSIEDALFDYLLPTHAPRKEDAGRHFESNWSERYLLIDGKFISLTDLSKQVGIKRATLHSRLFIYKFSIEETLKHNDGTPDFEHGTKSGYDYYRCRCDLCREANNTYARQYAKRKKQAEKES